MATKRGAKKRARGRKGEGHIRPRGEHSFEITLEGPRRADGRRNQIHENVRGTWDDAIERKSEMIVELKRGKYSPLPKGTVGEFLDLYHSTAVTVKKVPRMVRKDRLVIDNTLKPELGDIRLADLTPLRVQQFVNYLNLDRKLAPATVESYHKVLRRAFEWGRDMKIVQENPADKTELPSDRRMERPREIDLEVVKKALTACSDKSFFLAVLLLAHTGLRTCEVLGLWYDDFDLGKGEVHIRRDLAYVPSTDTDARHYWSYPKNVNTVRVHPIDEVVVDAVAKQRRIAVGEYGADGLRAILEDAHAELMREEKGKGAVFIKDLYAAQQVCNLGGGKLLNVSSFSTLFRKVMNKENLDFHPHKFRHGYASLLSSRKAPDAVMKDLLGHSSVLVTDDYTHALSGEGRRFVEDVGKLLR